MFKVLYKDRYYTVYQVDKGVEKISTGTITGGRNYLRFLIYDDKNNEWTYVNANECIPYE